MLGRCIRLCLTFGLLHSASIGLAAEPTTGGKAASVDFFEVKIRPVLIEHCYQCHSEEADEIGGSLLLDTPDAMRLGGDSGPAVVPGEMESSVLVSALRYESSEMPPSGKLPDHVIRDFESWIKAGAVDPRSVSGKVRTPRIASGIDLEEGRQFWAFQPLQYQTSPTEYAASDPIDGFLLDRLSKSGVEPLATASPATRLRRLLFDLTGLPPTIESMTRWLADPSDAHWKRIVDEQLASVEFARHWARHWMDVARYADSNGSDFNATFHDAWRYREYLIDSLASDRAIDEMIRQQIAGDLMPADSDSDRYDQLVATTFLMLGTKMLSERNKTKLTMDVVDEQIDTVGRAIMGLTLGCARCHDHKFDPVGMQDYYALAGIFKSTQSLKGESQEFVSTWKPTQLPAEEKLLSAHRAYDQGSKDLSDQLKRIQSKLKELNADKRDLTGLVIDDEDAIQTGDWQHSTYVSGFIGKGYAHDENRDKGKMSIRFETLVPAAAEDSTAESSGSWECRLWYTSGSSRAKRVPVTVTIGNEKHQILFDQSQGKTQATFGSLGQYELAPGQPLSVEISNKDTQGYVTVDAVQWVPLDDSLAQSSKDPAASDNAVAINELKELEKQLQAKIKEHQKNKPPRLPHAMAVSDRPSNELADCQIHIRGEVGNLGDAVPRGFLRVCGEGNALIESPNGSGRLELAHWLTDPDHPLTARVFVNRVWMWLMGEGIVRTVDNFGQRGERPSHPELLDALAIDFIRGGWQLKPLIRRIVCSDAYNRASMNSTFAESVDAENRLFWRAHRRRLPAESIRDSMLAVSGLLDRSGLPDPMAGYGVLVSNNNADSVSKQAIALNNPRRTIFLPVIRSEIPALLATLDAADPDLLVGKRPTTNVPAQALALIGSEEVQGWADATAERLLAHSVHESLQTLEEQASWLYQLVYQREVTPEDIAILRSYFKVERSESTSVSADRGEPSQGLGPDDSRPAATPVPSIHDREQWKRWVAAMFAATEFRIIQ